MGARGSVIGRLLVTFAAFAGLIGIPEHDQKELFTRFYRASNAIAPGSPARA